MVLWILLNCKVKEGRISIDRKDDVIEDDAEEYFEERKTKVK